jgi:hypothetical protein
MGKFLEDLAVDSFPQLHYMKAWLDARRRLFECKRQFAESKKSLEHSKIELRALEKTFTDHWTLRYLMLRVRENDVP